MWSFRTSSWADGTLLDPGTPLRQVCLNTPRRSSWFPQCSRCCDRKPAAASHCDVTLQGRRVGSHISGVQHEAVSAAPCRDGSLTAPIYLFIYLFIQFTHASQGCNLIIFSRYAPPQQHILVIWSKLDTEIPADPRSERIPAYLQLGETHVTSRLVSVPALVIKTTTTCRQHIVFILQYFVTLQTLRWHPAGAFSVRTC